MSQQQINQELCSILEKPTTQAELTQDRESIIAEFELENTTAKKHSYPKKTPAFILALVQKYGNDLKKMSMDTQLNRLQLSQGQLKKLLQA